MEWKPPDVNILVKFNLGTALPNIHFKTSRTLTWFLPALITLQSPGCTDPQKSTATHRLVALLLSYYCYTSLINSSLHSKGNHCPTLPKIPHSAVTFTECFGRWQEVLIPVTCTRLDEWGVSEGELNSINFTVDQQQLWERDFIPITLNITVQVHSWPFSQIFLS